MSVVLTLNVSLSSLFQNSPAQKNDVFHLAIQDVGGIGQVLDYMYTSHLELNQDNVHTLMEIAQSLQVTNTLFSFNSFPEYFHNIPETSLKFVFWLARKIYFTEIEHSFLGLQNISLNVQVTFT